MIEPRDIYRELVCLVLTEHAGQRRIHNNVSGIFHMPELALTYALEKRLRVCGDVSDTTHTYREFYVRENRHVDFAIISNGGPRLLIEVKQDCCLDSVAEDGVKLYNEVFNGDIGLLINIKEEWADVLNQYPAKRTRDLNESSKKKGTPKLNAAPVVDHFEFVSCGAGGSGREKAAVICAWQLSVQV